MGLKTTTTAPISSSSSHFPNLSPPYILLTRYTLIRQNLPVISLRKNCRFLFPIPVKLLSNGRSKHYTKSTEESTAETSTGDNDDDDSGEFQKVTIGDSKRNVSSLSDALNLGSRDPVYEVCFDF